MTRTELQAFRDELTRAREVIEAVKLLRVDDAFVARADWSLSLAWVAYYQLARPMVEEEAA